MEAKEQTHKKDIQELEVDNNRRYQQLKEVYQTATLTKSNEKSPNDRLMELEYLEKIRDVEKTLK